MINWRSDEFDANRANDDEAMAANFHPAEVPTALDANEANQFGYAYQAGLGF